MFHINFYISNYTDKSGNAQLVVKVKSQSKRLPIKVPVRWWNKERQICEKNFVHWFEVNSKLAEFRIFLEKSYFENPIQDLKFLTDNFFKGTKKELMTLDQAFDIYFESKMGINSAGYEKKFKIYKNDYFRAGISKIDVQNCDVSVFLRLRQYLLSKNNNNTAERKLRAFKGFVNYIHNNIMEIDIDWLRKVDLPRKFSQKIIALTENELELIKHAEIKPFLEHSRDVFLFACNTGARYSDLLNFKHSDIIDGHWHLRTKKTKTLLQIPLNAEAERIAKKYEEFGSLKLKTIKQLNLNIRQICRMAGLNEIINKSNFQGSKRTDKQYEKWQLITCHTGRRTFITIALTKGIPQQIVMRVSGHSNYETFKKYIDFVSDVVSSTFRQFWK